MHGTIGGLIPLDYWQLNLFSVFSCLERVGSLSRPQICFVARSLLIKIRSKLVSKEQATRGEINEELKKQPFPCIEVLFLKKPLKRNRWNVKKVEAI